MRSKTHKNDTPKLFMKNIFSLREKDTVRGKIEWFRCNTAEGINTLGKYSNI